MILLGAPGSGKGTQGVVLAERYDIAHISSGDILRHHIATGTPLGVTVQGFVSRGELVPDEVLIDLLQPEVIAAVEAGGYVLDGFPRSLTQAEAAYEIAKPIGITADAVVHLAVDDDEVVRRIAARAGEGRSDDADPKIIKRRLEIYHSETQPLLDFYGERGILHTIAAAGSPDDVTEAIAKSLAHIG